MNYEALFARSGDRVVSAALVGAGQFGQSLIGQARRIDRLAMRVVCDRDMDRLRALCAGAGIEPASYAVCTDAGEAQRAMAAGRMVLVADAALVPGLPVDIVVEATGVPEVSTATAVACIDAGRHVAMVTKETESVIGPWLWARARKAGVHYTPVDGDQPALLLGLLAWARALGLDVVCGGKSSEYDFVWDGGAGAVHCHGERHEVGDLSGLWSLGPDAGAVLAARARAVAGIAQRTVPDLCEMLVVINHSDLAPSCPQLNVPVARPGELPEIFRPRADGGILACSGVVDVFNCYRRPDEMSFAGGVFVIVRCDGKDTWSVLAGKGHPVSADGSHAMIFNAQHLLGVEAPMSLLQTCLLDLPTGGTCPRQRYDLVAHAARDIAAGEVLTVDDAHHHEISSLSPALMPYAPVAEEGPLPYYMAEGRTVTRDTARGEPITAAITDRPRHSALWAAREDMDRDM